MGRGCVRGGLGVLLLLIGCAPWDLAELEARYPALAQVGAAPLARLVPYFIASQDQLTAFTCRWPDGATLGVAVTGDASAHDLRILDAALGAWNGAGLGVRFARGAEPVVLEVVYGDPSRQRSGTAEVECRVRWSAGDPLQAQLVSARLALRRRAIDWRGQPVVLGEAERLGAALHELGHALGFQGHPQRGSVMVRSVDQVRRAGQSLLAGEPFADAALGALYALPSGTRLGAWPLPAGRTRALDALQGASQAGAATWWVRVGDAAAQLHGGPGSTRFSVSDPAQIFRDPNSFHAIPLTQL